MIKITLLILVLMMTACSPAGETASAGDVTATVEVIEETLAPTLTPTPEPTVISTEELTPEMTPTQRTGNLETVIYANARSCPWMTCPVTASFAEGVRITGGEPVEGGRFEGSTDWWRIEHEGQTMYIHDSLVRAGR